VNFVDPEGKNPIIILIGLYFLLGDEWLNAPGFGDVPQEGMTPMNELGLCMVTGGYSRTNLHGPHQGLGPHLHWGPVRKIFDSTKVPLKWHLGPRNPNHGLPKGQSGWPGLKEWWKAGAPIRWK
jgi:hypothetical protein